jgi:hypothetical protein
MPQALIPYILFAASVVIQVVQANNARAAQQRAQAEAEARADAAKGFQLVRSSEVLPIPILYGKNKVGGTRVYHNTFSDYKGPGHIANYDTTLAANGILKFSSNATQTLTTPAAGSVIVYFVAPAFCKTSTILNTDGVDSLPVITEAPPYEFNNNH